MDLYFSKLPTAKLQTNHILSTLSNLYRLRIISDESKVWADVGDFAPRLWALTNRSTCIHYLVTNVPGCVRITADRVRWAPTQDGSQSNPELDIDLTEVLPESDSFFTLVIEHCSPDQGVSIIESTSKQSYDDGVYTSETSSVKVIDANAYQASEMLWRKPDGTVSASFDRDARSFFPRVTEIERADAITKGFKFMSKSMTKAERMKLRDQFDLFRVELDPVHMRDVVKRATYEISLLSEDIQNEISNRLTQQRP